MGVFISNAITDRGRILLGEAQVGATFEATRIVMGSGYIPAGYTARTMTAVVAPVIELAINKKRRAGDGTVTFGGVYSNENITEAFYFREFALYARVEYADGTYSDEVLYSYGNAGDNADLMPAYSTSTVVEKQMDLVTWVGNETAVNLSVVSGIYNPHAEKHVADGEDPLTPAMIGAVAETDITRPKYMGYDFTNDLNKFTGYRSGTFSGETTANVPDPIHPFYDVWNSSGSGRFYSQFASVVNDDIIYFRKYYDGVFTEWRLLSVKDGFLPIAGGTLKGSLGVSNGLGLLFSWQAEGDAGLETGTGIDAYIGDTIARLEVVNKEGRVEGFLSFIDGDAWVNHQILHTGNAPAVIATAELV